MFRQIPDEDLIERRTNQKVDPFTGIIYSKEVYNPDKIVASVGDSLLCNTRLANVANNSRSLLHNNIYLYRKVLFQVYYDYIISLLQYIHSAFKFI